MEDGDEMKTDDNGATLLMIALREGNVGAVELLLGRKEIEDKDADSNNVFHYALGSLKVKDVTQVLANFVRDSGVGLENFFTAQNKTNKDTPLHVLAGQKLEDAESCQIVDFLTDEELFDLMKERDLTRETPLHRAAEQGNTIFLDAASSCISFKP